VNFRQLEVFHAIMTSGSLTEAARNLNVTQPSLSTVLKHAEDQLGLKLFERVGGRLVPTPEADQLFPEVDRIFSQVGSLRRFTQDLRDGRTGFLAIVGHPTLTNGLLPPAVARFLTGHPQIRIRVESGAGARISDRVARREFDLGLVYGPASDSETGIEIVGSSQIAVALRHDHPLTRLNEIRCTDLIGHNIITFGASAPIRKLIEKNFSEAGVELNPVVEVSYSTTACLLVAEGAGVGIIDPIILRTGPFPTVVLRPFVPVRTVEFQLLHPKNRPRSQISKDFEQVLRQVIVESAAISYTAFKP
jgi:DNA-binding transcriptional LysR family regulator